MKSNLKHVKNINRNKGFAEMFIYDEIGDGHVNGNHFAHELKYLLDYEGVNEIRVRINSVGGNVIHGFSIFSAIINANKEGARVDTYNDGVAASSAGFILLAGKNVFSKDYARVMIHGVTIDDEERAKNLSENDRNALQSFSDMIKTVIVGKTGLAPEFVNDLLTNGRDNWYNAEEAADLGFYNKGNIEKTGLIIDLPEDLSRNALQVANKAQKIINSLTPNTFKMKKVINALKLQEGSSEDVIAQAVNKALEDKKNAETALKTANNKLDEANATIAEQKTKIEASNRSAAVSIVENAIKEGKFAPKTDDEKNALVDTCVKDVESFKNTLSLMPTKSAKIGNEIDNKGGEAKSLLERVNNRTFRQLEKEEPSLLNEIKNSAKNEYAKMYNAQYNTQKTAEDFR